MRAARLPLAAAFAAALVAGCASATERAVEPAAEAPAPVPVEEPVPVPDAAPTTTTTAAAPTTTTRSGSPVEIAYRVDVRTAGIGGFPAAVAATLTDPRGWGRAGFRFVERQGAPFVIVLAEGPEVDALCRPYETRSTYSCQNGPVVALNADRWRTATPKWTGDLATYREYLVNHEVGHLLGMRHPRVQCTRPGRPAPIMNQQSTELRGCLPNAWPLADEVVLAARRPADLAPPPDEE